MGPRTDERHVMKLNAFVMLFEHCALDQSYYSRTVCG